jgi:Na+-transporting NADH:ubiquinone oxidoreductase subunit C
MSANRDSVGYTMAFAAGVCLVCAVVVASAAVVLRPKQDRNALVDRLSKVLEVAGLMDAGEALRADEVVARFEKFVKPRAIDLRTGQYDEAIDAATYDQRKAAKDPATSYPAPANDARVFRLPERAIVYHVVKDGALERIILPIQGYGLWSTLYGYLALEADGETVAGITFYEHGETPGLGGEVENPRWRARWQGRKAFDEAGDVQLRVAKGSAGSPEDDPYRVDGLSGATITSRGVSSTLAFWLGPDGFGPYLKHYRAERGARSAR